MIFSPVAGHAPQHWIGSHPGSLFVVVCLAASCGVVIACALFAAREDEESRKLRAELREAMSKNVKLHEDLDRAKRANLDAIAVGMSLRSEPEPQYPTWPSQDFTSLRKLPQ